MQTSCFFLFQFFQNLNSMTSITGGGGSCSDFLSLQNLASSEQISFSLVFFRMRVSGSRHLYSLLVVSLEILYYYWMEKVVLTTLGLLKRDLFKACYKKAKETNLWSWLNIFFWSSNIVKTTIIYRVWFLLVFITNDMILWAVRKVDIVFQSGSWWSPKRIFEWLLQDHQASLRQGGPERGQRDIGEIPERWVHV